LDVPDVGQVLAEARQADEFDEALPLQSGLQFESQTHARGQMGVALTVLRHSQAGSAKCELLENSYYHAEVATVLCVVLRALPDTQLSVETVVSILSRTQRPGACAEIVVAIARNCPERFDLVIRGALVSGPVLNRLAELSPLSAMRVRDALAEAQVLPDLALHLTVHSVRDPLLFCAASMRNEASWIRSYFQQNQEKENSPAARMRAYLLHAADDPENKTPQRLGHLLNLLSGACGMWGLRFSAGSSQRLVAAIVANAAQSRTVAEQGLCFLLVCEGLAKLLPPELLGECIRVLAQSAVQAVVALVTVRFASKGQLALTAAWAKKVAAVPVSIHGESLQLMGAAWRETIPETALATRALSMQPVVGLSEAMENDEDGPAVTMKELMASHVLIRTRADPVGWMAKQIAVLDVPLHPCVPDLVTEFVSCCLFASPSALTPVAPEQVAELQRSGSLASRLVAAYLVLSHNAAVKQLGEKTRVPPYPLTLVEGFGLKRLLGRAMADGRFDTLPEKVMVLCLSEFPEMMASERGFVLREVPVAASWLLSEQSQEWNVSALHRELAQLARQPDELLCRESTVSRLLVEILPRLLEQSEVEDVMLLFGTIWHRLFKLMPDAVSVATVNAVLTQTLQSVTSAGLIANPLLILRVKPVVYLQCPAIFGLLLEVLSVYTTTSRKRILGAALAASEASSEREGLTRLAVVQDCAISQMVIEIIALSPSSDTRVLACAFLHQLWLEHPRVIELLHYQRYSPAVVPVLVQHVPSLHVGMDLLPALLASPKPGRRMWAVHLASFLLPKYATPRALEIARLIFHAVLSGAHNAPTQTLAFVRSCLPAWRRLLEAFPMLVDEHIELCESLRGQGGGEQEIWDAIVSVYDLPE
jgi:hypothetical protein